MRLPSLAAIAALALSGCATARPPGFVAVYRWTLQPNCEATARAAWREEAERYRTRYGSCGARLHREDDGSLVSVALWRSREDWARAPRPIDLPQAEAELDRCIATKVEELHLAPLEDVGLPVCE